MIDLRKCNPMIAKGMFFNHQFTFLFKEFGNIKNIAYLCARILE